MDLSAQAGGGATVTFGATAVRASSSFAVYPSAPPHQPSDITLAPTTGVSVPQGLSMTAAGAAIMTALQSQSVHFTTRPDGVGHMTASPIFAWVLRQTSNGRASGTWYLGSPVRMATASHGVGHVTAYESGLLDLGVWTAHGSAHMTNYLTGPVYLAGTAHGVAALTVDPERMMQRWTANARATVTVTLSRAQTTAAAAHGISTMTIEIQGVPLLRSTSAGIAGGSVTLTDVRNYYGFKVYAGSYGTSSYSSSGFYGPSYYVDENKLGLNWQGRNFPSFSQTFGVKALLFQDVQFVANGVTTLTVTLGRRAFISLTSHGVGQMSVIPPPQLAMRTKTNLDYLAQNGAYLYTPDRWLMNAIWALFNRSRGRSHVDLTMFMRTVYGDLLHRYWSSERPGDPDVDGGSRPAAGQYWPRQLKLPHREVPTPYPYWYEYEYERR